MACMPPSHGAGFGHGLFTRFQNISLAAPYCDVGPESELEGNRSRSWSAGCHNALAHGAKTTVSILCFTIADCYLDAPLLVSPRVHEQPATISLHFVQRESRSEQNVRAGSKAPGSVRAISRVRNRTATPVGVHRRASEPDHPARLALFRWRCSLALDVRGASHFLKTLNSQDTLTNHGARCTWRFRLPRPAVSKHVWARWRIVRIDIPKCRRRDARPRYVRAN